MSRNGGRWLPPKFVEKDLSGRAFGPTWIRWTVCACAQRPWSGRCQDSTGRTASSFFILIQKEPAIVRETFSPFIISDIRTSSFFSADVLKKCALLALHTIAEEGRDGDGFQVPSLGDEWKMGCPKSPMWESEGEAWSRDEDASSAASREGNVRLDGRKCMRPGRCCGCQMSLALRKGEGGE